MKGQKILQLAAEKKYSKNGAAGKFFGPSYSVTALVLNQNNFSVMEVHILKSKNPQIFGLSAHCPNA